MPNRRAAGMGDTDVWNNRPIEATLAAKADEMTHELGLAQLQIDEDKGNINDLVKESAGMAKRIKELER